MKQNTNLPPFEEIWGVKDPVATEAKFKALMPLAKKKTLPIMQN